MKSPDRQFNYATDLFRALRPKTMKKDKHVTRVIFYKEFDGEILAVFPDTHRRNKYECYAHVGQHTECGAGYLKKCEVATPSEYQDLYRELENIGYNLKVTAPDGQFVKYH